MNTSRREQGQVLVLIILAIVGMLGFAALAVDLGRVFSERRRAQNAADAAVMAAAYRGQGVTVTSGNTTPRANAARTAADASLRLNDYVDDHINQADGLPVEIQVHYPPISGPYAGNVNYYQVIIYQDVEKVFSHFVFGGLLDFTVEAVAQAETSMGMMEGNAIVALSPDTCGALWFTGTSDIRIRDGGALSLSRRTGDLGICNGDTSTASDPNSCVSGLSDGSGAVILDEGHQITIHGRFRDASGGGLKSVNDSGTVVSTDPNTLANVCAPIPPMPVAPKPICPIDDTDVDGDGNRTEPRPGVFDPVNLLGEIYMNPGTYEAPLFFNGPNDKIRLKEGLYCLKEGLIAQNGNITGSKVMFYVEGGSFILSGQVSASLLAATDLQGAILSDGTIDPDFQWGGMLLYMPYENQNEVVLGAGSQSFYTGTIYAPGPRPRSPSDNPNDPKYKCIIGGGSGTIGLNASVICDTVKLDGNASIDIKYNADANFKFPPSYSLSQ